jgi:hypothetical protein
MLRRPACPAYRLPAGRQGRQAVGRDFAEEIESYYDLMVVELYLTKIF